MLALLRAVKFKRVSRAGLVLVQPVHSSTVLVESLLALGSKVLRVSASDVVNGKENIGYHCGLSITYLGKPGVGGTRMSSSPTLLRRGTLCGHSLFMHYDCISSVLIVVICRNIYILDVALGRHHFMLYPSIP